MPDEVITAKRVICPCCGWEFAVRLRIGEREWKDGYHGECDNPHCGFWYFEEVNKEVDHVG